MSDIVLTTLNAKYAHASFGLRYLHANLGDLRERTELLEFDISQRTVDVLEALLQRDPKSQFRNPKSSFPASSPPTCRSSPPCGSPTTCTRPTTSRIG